MEYKLVFRNNQYVSINFDTMPLFKSWIQRVPRLWRAWQATRIPIFCAQITAPTDTLWFVCRLTDMKRLRYSSHIDYNEQTKELECSHGDFALISVMKYLGCERFCANIVASLKCASIHIVDALPHYFDRWKINSDNVKFEIKYALRECADGYLLSSRGQYGSFSNTAIEIIRDDETDVWLVIFRSQNVPTCFWALSSVSHFKLAVRIHPSLEGFDTRFCNLFAPIRVQVIFDSTQPRDHVAIKWSVDAEDIEMYIVEPDIYVDTAKLLVYFCGITDSLILSRINQACNEQNNQDTAEYWQDLIATCEPRPTWWKYVWRNCLIVTRDNIGHVRRGEASYV